MDKNLDLDTKEWKVAHVDTGTCISIPHQNPDGSFSDAWVLGPMSRRSADWLIDAIKMKQNLIKQQNIVKL